MPSSSDPSPAGPGLRSGGVWGHFLVSASACILTITIVGSALFLAYRLYDRQQLRKKVQVFIASLENRTPAELQERAAQLRDRPKLAEYVLPELRATLASAQSEQQLAAAISLARAFVDRRRIQEALFALRWDPREIIAGPAVEALATLQPPERAADLLGQCLDGADAGLVCPAVVDAACAGLFQLGGPGLDEIKRRSSSLTPTRRVWLVGFVDQVGGPYRQAWLELLRSDPDTQVKAAADKAMSVPSGTGAPSSTNTIVNIDEGRGA